jgi:hypothetical protein
MCSHEVDKLCTSNDLLTYFDLSLRCVMPGIVCTLYDLSIKSDPVLQSVVHTLASLHSCNIAADRIDLRLRDKNDSKAEIHLLL